MAAPAQPAEEDQRAAPDRPVAAGRLAVAGPTAEEVARGPEPVAARTAGAAEALPIAEAALRAVRRVGRRAVARLEVQEAEHQGSALGPRVRRKTDKTYWSAGCLRHTACKRS